MRLDIVTEHDIESAAGQSVLVHQGTIRLTPMRKNQDEGPTSNPPQLP